MTDQNFSGTIAASLTDSTPQTVMVDGLELDQRQTLAYREWQQLSTSNGPPLQRDFRPDRITRALPAALLLHVERQGDAVHFTQRLEGRFVSLAFGEGAGHAIEDLYTDQHLDDMLPRYLESAMTGDAAMTKCSAPKKNGEIFEFTRLILPFAGVDGAVNRLLVVFYFEPVALAKLSGPLQVQRSTLDGVDVGGLAVGSLQTRQAG